MFSTAKHRRAVVCVGAVTDLETPIRCYDDSRRFIITNFKREVYQSRIFGLRKGAVCTLALRAPNASLPGVTGHNVRCFSS